jgi:transcription initiation factor IIF auxiliary subunit
VVGNTAKEITDKDILSKSKFDRLWDWTMFVRCKNEKDEQIIKQVDFELHPTYRDPKVRVVKAPFELKRRAWGYFEITAKITF